MFFGAEAKQIINDSVTSYARTYGSHLLLADYFISQRRMVATVSVSSHVAFLWNRNSRVFDS